MSTINKTFYTVYIQLEVTNW